MPFTRDQMRTYNSWYAMNRRCYDPTHRAYKWYGAKDITVCSDWSWEAGTFRKFLEDMGNCPAKLTLDRKDNSKPYSKDNCRWATWRQQHRNQQPGGFQMKSESIVNMERTCDPVSEI